MRKGLFGGLFLLCLVGAQQSITVVQTARDTGDRLTTKDPVNWQDDFPSPVTISVSSAQRYQKLLGFGGAFTEASAYVFSTLNSSLQAQFLEAYWGPTGLHYSIGRIPMNSCDFSLSSYSADDMVDDFLLTNFTIARDNKYIIPFVQAALNISERLFLFLTPWSPPGWMKINGNMDGSSSPLGLIQSTNVFKSWALYYSKFISAYQKEGIDLWGLTVQNEPEYSANKTITPYEACMYTAEAQRDFIKYYLGPQLAVDHPDVNIMIYDHNKDHVAIWAQTILGDPEAAKYVAGTAFHWYTGPQFENLELAHQVDTEKFLLASEASICPPASLGNWTRGEIYAYDILGDLNNWAIGWTDWNVLLDVQGGPNHVENYCDAFIIGDAATQTLYFNPTYYYMGQFSKFLPTGSERINITCGGGLNCTAFLTPTNEISVVVLNTGDNPVTFKLQYGIQPKQAAKILIPEHAIATYTWQVEVSTTFLE